MVTTDGGNQVAITCISVGVVLMQFTAIIACSFHAVKKLNTGANQAAKKKRCCEETSFGKGYVGGTF